AIRHRAVDDDRRNSQLDLVRADWTGGACSAPRGIEPVPDSGRDTDRHHFAPARCLYPPTGLPADKYVVSEECPVAGLGRCAGRRYGRTVTGYYPAFT